MRHERADENPEKTRSGPAESRIQQFKETVRNDRLTRDRVWEMSSGEPMLLEGIRPEDVRSGRPTDALEGALEKVGIQRGQRIIVFEHVKDEWLLDEVGKRYVLRTESGEWTITRLNQQGIVFDQNEPMAFVKYQRLVAKSCMGYRAVVKGIREGLEQGRTIYEKVSNMLGERYSVGADMNVESLQTETNRVARELCGDRYPLLQLLEDRIIYLWSLLEMFQMRNGSVRLGTLVTGQCQLTMEDPHVERLLPLEIGGDPVFRATIPFLFCGAKGEEEYHAFQRLSLLTVHTTLSQQRYCLETEWRHVDADLSGAEYARLAAKAQFI